VSGKSVQGGRCCNVEATFAVLRTAMIPCCADRRPTWPDRVVVVLDVGLTRNLTGRITLTRIKSEFCNRLNMWRQCSLLPNYFEHSLLAQYSVSSLLLQVDNRFLCSFCRSVCW